MKQPEKDNSNVKKVVAGDVAAWAIAIPSSPIRPRGLITYKATSPRMKHPKKGNSNGEKVDAGDVFAWAIEMPSSPIRPRGVLIFRRATHVTAVGR